ncbi:unnamed protein product, partial [Mycena citricolor]
QYQSDNHLTSPATTPPNSPLLEPLDRLTWNSEFVPGQNNVNNRKFNKDVASSALPLSLAKQQPHIPRVKGLNPSTIQKTSMMAHSTRTKIPSPVRQETTRV